MGKVPTWIKISMRKEGKRMMNEEKWENAGRDLISLEELYDLYQDGFEFVVRNGHIISVLFQV